MKYIKPDISQISYCNHCKKYHYVVIYWVKTFFEKNWPSVTITNFKCTICNTTQENKRVS